MSIRVNQNSFSKGVISPSLAARVDLNQYALGLKSLNNGIVLQEGCVVNRSGLEYVGAAKYQNKKSRLIPFVFDINQNYIIEMGNHYFRFIIDGGYILNNNNQVYEISSPYNEEDIFNIDYAQQGDVITFVHSKYPPKELSRIAHNNWILSNINFNASIASPVNLSATFTGDTTENTTTYYYVVCSVDSSTNEESERSAEISVLAHLEAYWTTSEYITISWDSVENAVEYNVYRSVNGIFGYVGTTSTNSFVDNNIEPDLASSAPIYKNPFSNENPSCVCYYQQRKLYASSDISPSKLWASQTGTNNNFNISRPLNATDAITLSVHDNVSNTIKHLIPFDNLIVLTNNGEWLLTGNDDGFCANPLPNASIQSYYGSSKIKPVISGSMVIFVQSGGNIVRDLGYNYLSNAYDGEELTLFANHLFEGKQIVDMAYSKEPYRILWCVMNDGTINALTYNQKQKICAWHTHSTKGNFESVAVVRENNEDIAYFVIKRNINGNDVRYIERFKTRIINSLDDSFFLDCAIKTKFQNPVSDISGLNHLANENVVALLDNGVVTDLQVDANGQLTLPYPAKDVLIGFPYEFKFETLNLDTQETLGLNKLINNIEIKILNSREDFFILNDDGSLFQNARCHESINYPNKLFSKDVVFCPLSNPTKQANITIIQKHPLPINILAINATLSLENVESQ